MWGGEGGKEERNKQNPAKTRQSWCFKMCTGTPHCGSGVQAGDELLIPTSSIRALPLLPLPPAAPPPPPPAPLSADLSDSGEMHGEKDKDTSPPYASLGGLKTHKGRGGQH